MPESHQAFDDRLTHEVASLSTKLVTEVAKLLELEEKLLQLRRENQILKTKNTEIEAIGAKYEKLLTEHTKLQEMLKSSDVLRKEAEAKIAELEGEVEDLTASLFDEANKMVSDASRETYNFKVKNGKLYEELHEKNTIIEDLQEQLKDLKLLFFQMEEQHRAIVGPQSSGHRSSVTNLYESAGNETELSLLHDPLNSYIFTPSIRGIRIDMVEYHQEFKPFIYAILKPNFTIDLPNLKTLKHFKKIWNEELENSILAVPTPSTLYNRWQKGKSFWNLIAEGKASIVPISSVNETYKLTYAKSGQNLQSGPTQNQEPPIATKEPCSFCNESQDDILEHARLYSLKLLNPEYDPQGTTTSLQEEILGSYPLCNYCLVKLRNICEFFAKIRLIHSNVYKLEMLKDEDVASSSLSSASGSSPSISATKRFNRLSGMISEGDLLLSKKSLELKRVRTSQPRTEEESQDEAKILRLYIMLVQIRAKIFWSKVGYWDNSMNLIETNLDEIHSDAYVKLFGIQAMEPAPPKIEKVATAPAVIKTTESSTVARSESPEYGTPEAENDVSIEVTKVIEELPKNSLQAPQASLDEPILVHSEEEDEEEYTDTAEGADSASATKNSNGSNGISRRKSKSKKFTKKINDDLNETLAMLQESLED